MSTLLASSMSIPLSTSSANRPAAARHFTKQAVDGLRQATSKRPQDQPLRSKLDIVCLTFAAKSSIPSPASQQLFAPTLDCNLLLAAPDSKLAVGTTSTTSGGVLELATAPAFLFGCCSEMSSMNRRSGGRWLLSLVELGGPESTAFVGSEDIVPNKYSRECDYEGPSSSLSHNLQSCSFGPNTFSTDRYAAPFSNFEAITLDYDVPCQDYVQARSRSDAPKSAAITSILSTAHTPALLHPSNLDNLDLSSMYSISCPLTYVSTSDLSSADSSASINVFSQVPLTSHLRISSESHPLVCTRPRAMMRAANRHLISKAPSGVVEFPVSVADTVRFSDYDDASLVHQYPVRHLGAVSPLALRQKEAPSDPSGVSKSSTSAGGQLSHCNEAFLIALCLD
jgi:hypothetical protein